MAGEALELQALTRDVEISAILTADVAKST